MEPEQSTMLTALGGQGESRLRTLYGIIVAQRSKGSRVAGILSGHGSSTRKTKSFAKELEVKETKPRRPQVQQRIAQNGRSVPFLALIACIGIVLVMPPHASAQLNSGNAILKGNFAEAGIGHDGVFGSDVAPPSGFHPRDGGGLLGYVADDDKDDGWATDYDGESFLPGTPEESFTVRVGGRKFTNVNGSTPPIPGSLSNEAASNR